MFVGSRRQRPPNPPLTAATANPHAATAAAAAAAVFKHHASYPSLSEAAAAAALAARPMTPTRVAEVQTKRTLRRNASVASSAAESEDQTRPGLRRRGSSSSMSERTFRSPSPHRPGPSGLSHQQSRPLSHVADEEAPPVPALPRDVDPGASQPAIATQRPRKTHSLGMGTTPLRLASQKLASEGSSSWFGAAKTGDPASVRRTDPAMASPPSSPPQAPPEEQRSGSRASSINFSYPARIRVGSPTGSPVEARHSTGLPASPDGQRRSVDDQDAPHGRQSKQYAKKRFSEPNVPSNAQPRAISSDQPLVYDPNSRRMVRPAELRAVEYTILEAAQQPTKSKRKKQTTQRAGSHLAKGTMGRTRSITSTNAPGTDVGATVAVDQAQPRAREHSLGQTSHEDFDEPAVKAIISSPRIEAKRLEQQRSQWHDLQIGSSEYDALSAPGPSSTSREFAGQAVRRQPYTVKEESEPESVPENATRRVIVDALDAVPTRLRVHVGPGYDSHLDFEQQQRVSQSLDDMHHAPQVSAPGPRSPTTSPIRPDQLDAPSDAFSRHQVLEHPKPDIAKERTHSNSPVRQAHFGPVSNSLTVKHSPPPRSISPRKSALKYSSPSRGASPSDDTSEASAGAFQRDEPPMTRKKSVRVSFDDGNTVVVGESAPPVQTDSPLLSSPQHTTGRRPWFSAIGRNRKELPSLDDDEIMKPRPALPSFGSVRDKKPRDHSLEEGERPLVRPISESIHTRPGLVGQSSDHAVGAILAKEQEERARIQANISRFREPLPPVVTSVEGSGYMSDTSSSSGLDDLVSFETVSTRLEPEQSLEYTGSNTDLKTPSHDSNKNPVPTTDETPRETSKERESTVPTISISQPSPPIINQKPLEPFSVSVPGGFPEDDSDLSAPNASPSTTPTLITAQSALTSATQPESAAPALEQKLASHTPTPGQDSLTPAANLDPASDSESSIYSDAYEDLSDIEGDGFLSLDAVVESPITTGAALPNVFRDTPTKKAPVPDDPPKLGTEISSATTAVDAHPQDDQHEWEIVKSYWRNLTVDKRAQLEREATEEAGVEADLEETKPVQKPKKKKSVERRNSERKALAVHLAQQMMVRQEKDKQAQLQRNYMIKPGTKWSEDDGFATSMPTTLRGASQPKPAAARHDGPHLRKSMRSNGPSVRGDDAARISEVEQSSAKATRPASLPVVPATASARVASRRSPQAEPAQSKQATHPPPLRRRGSTSSESSFRRARPATATQTSGFRMSMRQASPPGPQPERKSAKRFSLRSLSPPPVSMATGAHMRQTLRDSSGERKKSPSGMRLPSFHLSPGGKKSKKRASGPQFSSRFGNSSDEDDNRGKSGFRSRFEDSSDDESVPATSQAPMLRPPTVGHLRNQESIASTALPEELEESEEFADQNNSEKKIAGFSAPQPSQTAANTASNARTGTDETLSPQSTSDGRTMSISATTAVPERRSSTVSKRNSILSALRRKKNNTAGKISRPPVSESAARRDTKLERNPSQLRSIRKSGEGETEAEMEEEDAEETEARQEKRPPRSPKLQKRVAGLARSVETGNANANAAGGSELPSPLAPSPPIAANGPSSSLGLDAAIEKELGVGEAEDDFVAPLRRPGTSGNLGTRTLSGGSGPQLGFMQRRTVSSGVMSLEAPSTTGTSVRKKRFGALRRMFGLHD